MYKSGLGFRDYGLCCMCNPANAKRRFEWLYLVGYLFDMLLQQAYKYLKGNLCYASYLLK